MLKRLLFTSVLLCSGCSKQEAPPIATVQAQTKTEAPVLPWSSGKYYGIVCVGNANTYADRVEFDSVKGAMTILESDVLTPKLPVTLTVDGEKNDLTFTWWAKPRELEREYHFYPTETLMAGNLLVGRVFLPSDDPESAGSFSNEIYQPDDGKPLLWHLQNDTACENSGGLFK